MATARLSWVMNNMTKTRSAEAPEAPFARVDRLVTWILLGLGLLLMLASVTSAEEPSVSRVDRFNGSLKPGQTVHVENISGDVVASPGKEFSVVVTVTATASTPAKAQEILAATRIVTDHDEDGWSLETRWPGMHGSGRHGSPCDKCRIVARYEIVVPPGVTAELQTVNGDVRVRDCGGELKLESVNGTIEALGVRQELDARTVNGRINAVALALPPEAAMELQSVNGTVALTLPKDAKFDLSASTMNGTIASTFPLPVRAVEISPAEPPARRERGKASKDGKESGDRPSRVIVKTEDGETTVVDLRELERELESSMRDVEISIKEGMRDEQGGMEAAREGLREAQRELRQVRIGDPRKEYTGSIGKNGASVSLSTLNGGVVLLAAGTKEEDAKPLVSERRSFVVTVPRVEVHVARHPPLPPVPPAPPVAPVAPVPPSPRAPRQPEAPPPPEFEGEVVRGDIGGDFFSTSTGGNYRIGKVSGRVRILTHSGEITLGAAGAGADLKSFGGDIVVGPVTGDLKASTMAGDIRTQAVTGSVLADTAGGDIRIARVGGSLDAKTAGGDIIVPFVGGAVRAVTAGGDVRIGVTSREIPGGITIHNSGGDVSLVLPADCKADLELIVTGADEEDSAIHSDFAELAVSKRAGVQRATARLNGGGEKIVVKTSSGTIRLKKATS